MAQVNGGAANGGVTANIVPPGGEVVDANENFHLVVTLGNAAAGFANGICMVAVDITPP